MININSYTGKRYGFMTYNCWQHIVCVRKDAGIKTKMYTVVSMAGEVVASKFNEERTKNEHGLTLITKPQNYDIIIFVRSMVGTDYHHAGIYYDEYISHCCNAVGQVILEPLRNAVKNRRSIEFWR